jgi:hypothetical protein
MPIRIENRFSCHPFFARSGCLLAQRMVATTPPLSSTLALGIIWAGVPVALRVSRKISTGEETARGAKVGNRLSAVTGEPCRALPRGALMPLDAVSLGYLGMEFVTLGRPGVPVNASALPPAGEGMTRGLATTDLPLRSATCPRRRPSDAGPAPTVMHARKVTLWMNISKIVLQISESCYHDNENSTILQNVIRRNLSGWIYFRCQNLGGSNGETRPNRNRNRRRPA